MLPIAYVELGQENGGILLNLSEGGLAVRSALPLSAREFTGIRFQAPASQAWLTASGRIVWLSDSKKEGGIQFTGLPGEARQQIQKWASAHVDLEEQNLTASAKGGCKPPEQMPDRSGGENPEPAKASNARTQATQTQRELVPTLGQGVAGIAEPPAQAFRFTDYSMFAAAPENQVVWAVPARRRKGWGGTALLVLLIAALSFALGSTIGRGTLDGVIAYLTSEADNKLAPAPKVTPPAPPEQADAPTAAGDEKGAISPPDGDQVNAEGGANPPSGTEKNSQVAATPATEKTDELPKRVTQPRDSSSAVGGVNAADSPARSATARVTAERQPRYSADNAVPSNSREMDSGPSTSAAEHSILVNPPGPGGRPFYVNLPAEAISASSAIAISVQRALQIQPSASGRPERVVIGILKSHSDPFYPVEARKQRIEGSVKLRARVGRTGQIIGVTPVSGPDLLASAATAAVREWRYEPTFIDGDPVETQADITIVFRQP